MKKLLFLTIAIAMLTGCDKGEQTPPEPPTQLVGEVVMPASANPIKTNESVTIKGIGFLKGDKILLCAAVKSSSIDAVVTEITTSHIVFTVPKGLTKGENSVILKRDTKEQILGNIVIAEEASMKLYGLGWKSDNPADTGEQTELSQIDATTGNVTNIATFPDGMTLKKPLAIGHIIYAMGYVDGNRSIGSYNMDTKEFKKVSDRISNNSCYDVLGVIDGKLHVLVGVDDVIKLLLIDAETGAKSEVASFGKVEDSPYFNGFNIMSGGFAYDAKNKQIVVGGYWDGRQAEPRKADYTKTLVLDVTAKTIKYFDSTNDGFCFFRGSQICVMVQQGSNGSIYLLDDKYQTSTNVASLTNIVSYPAYDAVSDMIYGYSSEGLYSVDIKTMPVTQKTIAAGNKRVGELIVVR